MKYFILLISLIVVSSCGEDEKGSLCGDYLSLKLGQTKSVDINSGEQVSLELIRLDDSRCPADVICIRAGEVIADLRVNDDEVV